MNTIQSEPHVAQQSRRDKLRVQQNLPPPPSHHHNHHHLYDAPPMFSTPSGILDFTAPTADASFMNTAASGLQDGGGWIMNCVGGGGGGGAGGAGAGGNPIQIPCFPSHLYQMKQGISGYQDLSSELTSSQESHKQFGDLHFPSSHIYHSTLHDVVTSSSSAVPNHALEPSWGDGGNELLLLPSYANPANPSVWMNRQNQQWYGEGDAARMKAEAGIGAAIHGSTQSLSLSLSSNPRPELQAAQFDERLGQEELAALHSSRSAAGDVVGFSCPYPRITGSSVPGPIVSTADPRRCIGPLGPFTGYAAILKSSKFLKPAQLLLDEFCSVAAGLKLTRQRESLERSSGAGSARHDQALIGDSGGDGMRGNSCVSSSSFYSSTEGGGGGSGGGSVGGTGSGSASCQMHRPEFQQKKAKLLYMQEEVCRRYKQYHQQMQMVVSSFESVAGLSAATPYTSLALKSIAKHFRCLKNAISDQLRHVSKLMGEEFMSSPGSSKGDAITPGLKYADQSIRKHKAVENSLSFLDHSQPVWRPQRGLPERAVAVLRAWLFDHFLHPYPTDTDKHMLATQTGLSRNQVSNWFINARVRLWKPMVEEIHMLETKGMSGMDLNSTNRNEGKPVQDEVGQPSSDQMSEAHSNKPMDCSHLEPMFDEESSRAMEQWHREKRSRMEECGIPAGMDGSLMSFAAYQGGLDIGGLGAVSLTLGLRHNEGAQQQQQQQHMRRHFGNHMVHDFGG